LALKQLLSIHRNKAGVAEAAVWYLLRPGDPPTQSLAMLAFLDLLTHIYEERLRYTSPHPPLASFPAPTRF